MDNMDNKIKSLFMKTKNFIFKHKIISIIIILCLLGLLNKGIFLLFSIEVIMYIVINFIFSFVLAVKNRGAEILQLCHLINFWNSAFRSFALHAGHRSMFLLSVHFLPAARY